MSIFELEIDDGDVQRVFDAVCANYHRPESVENPNYIVTIGEEGEQIFPVDGNGDPVPATIENPESKGAFTHRMVREFLAGHVQSWETRQAKLSAVNSIDATVGLSDPSP